MGEGNRSKGISKDAEDLKVKEQGSFIWLGQSVLEELWSRDGY